jgi:hypothetical protein
MQQACTVGLGGPARGVLEKLTQTPELADINPFPQVESLLLSIVPDIQGELSDGIDEYFSKIKNEDGDPGEAQSEEEARQGCCAGIRAFMLYLFDPTSFTAPVTVRCVVPAGS